MRRALLLISLLVACGDDDDEDFDTQASMGRDNGESCIFTGAGAAICGGTMCLGIFESDIGICSEPCTTECKWGGVCGAVPDGTRVCLKPCGGQDDCPDEFARCLRPPEGILVCLETFDCKPPALEQRFCLPFDPNAPMSEMP